MVYARTSVKLSIRSFMVDLIDWFCHRIRKRVVVEYYFDWRRATSVFFCFFVAVISDGTSIV